MFTMKSLSLCLPDARSRRLLNFVDPATPHTYDKTKNHLSWDVISDTNVPKQRDSSSCGPLMLFSFMNQCIPPEEQPSLNLLSSMDEIRKHVLQKCKELYKIYQKDLKVYGKRPDLYVESENDWDTVPKPQHVDITSDVELDKGYSESPTKPTKGGPATKRPFFKNSDKYDQYDDENIHPLPYDAIPTPKKSSLIQTKLPFGGVSKIASVLQSEEAKKWFDEEEPYIPTGSITPGSIKRTQMLRDSVWISEKKKRRLQQDKQTLSMKKHYINSLPFLQRGSQVQIRPERSERANMGSRGILAIVLHCCTNSRSITAITEHGIIGSEGRTILIPPEKYHVQTNSKNVYGKLGEIKRMIIANSLDEFQFPKVSISECCRKIYGGTTGLASCNCNPSLGCRKNCGCRKKDIPCSSRCKCNGNCEYTSQLTQNN